MRVCVCVCVCVCVRMFHGPAMLRCAAFGREFLRRCAAAWRALCPRVPGQGTVPGPGLVAGTVPGPGPGPGLGPGVSTEQEAECRDVWTAAQQGRDKDLARLLPHAPEAARESAAFVAAQNDAVACLARLVDARVCVRARTPSRGVHFVPWSLLEVAARTNSCGAVAFLLQTARPPFAPEEVQSAAKVAAKKRHCHVLRLLVQAKADAHRLVLPALGRTTGEIDKDDWCDDVLQLLVDFKADVGQAVYLRRAISMRNVAAVQMILSAGVNPNDSVQLGFCRARRHTVRAQPVYAACVLRSADVLRALIRAKADIDVVDEACGKTPLFAAVHRHCDRTVRVLLRAKVDVNKRSGPFDLTPLCMLAGKSYLTGTMSLLLRAKADVDARDVAGCTPVFRAALHGRMDMLKELLAAGADVDLCVPANGWSPLHAAAYGGHRDVWKLLLKHAPRLKDGVTTCIWYGAPAGMRPGDLGNKYGTLTLASRHVTDRQQKDWIRNMEDLLRATRPPVFRRRYTFGSRDGYMYTWINE